MKTLAITLGAAMLLSLAACAKQDATTGNTDAAATNTAAYDENGTFASENVILPEDNATADAATDPIANSSNTD